MSDPLPTDEPVEPQAVISSEEAKRLFEKARARALPVAERYRAPARINESFYAGEQWSVLEIIGGKPKANKDAWFDKERVPRIAVNLYTGLHQTWTSLITADRPTVAAAPASEEPADTYRARLQQLIIEHIADEVEAAEKITDAVGLAGLGGTAGIKAIVKGEPAQLEWVPLSVHDFLIDPGMRDWRNSPWAIFEDHVSIEDAEELYKANNIDKKPSPTNYQNAAGDSMDGVVKYEFWFRPSSKFPRGFYACLIDDEVVELLEEYPILIEEEGRLESLLPCALMTVRKQPGGVYGNTNFTDAVPLQRAYNENVSRAQKIVRTTSNVHLKVPTEIADVTGFDPTESTMIKFPSAKVDAANAIGYTTPPQISQALFELRDYFAQAMEQVVGLNSTTSGSQSRSLSGRAIENLVELDKNRNADCTRSMQTMIEYLYRLSTVLVKQNYTDQRKAKMANEDVQTFFAFSGSDLDGADIRLEPASEIDTLATSREQIAAEKVGAGLANGGDVKRAQRQSGYGAGLAAAEQLLREFAMTGQVSELAAEVDFDAVEELVKKKKALALSQRDQAAWVTLAQFEKQMRALMQQADSLVPTEGQVTQ